MSFIDDMLNPQIKKEAMESQGTDKQDHYERKVKAHDWIKGISDLDPVQVEAEYQAKLKEEAMVLGKTAALDDVVADGVTPEETVNKDYKRDVVILSDYALAEMLAEARGHEKQNTSEMFYELKEKAKAEVASSREKAEKALLDLIPEHTMLDWQKAFKAFTKDAVPAEAKDKDLFKSDVPEKAHDFEHPTEEKFKLPKDADKAIPGNGREVDERMDATKEAGVLQDDIVAGTSKEASLKVKANELKDKIFKVLVDNIDLFNHQGDQDKATEYINELALALLAALQPEAGEHIEGLASAEKKADGPSASDNCPVCDGQGTDLANGMEDNMACQGCGITYGSFKIADLETQSETDSHKLKRLQLQLKELNPISDMAAYTSLLSQIDELSGKKAEIKSHASKAEVIQKIAELKKTAEVASSWEVRTDEQGNEVIARVDNTVATTKESEEVKPDELLK